MARIKCLAQTHQLFRFLAVVLLRPATRTSSVAASDERGDRISGRGHSVV